MMLGKIICGVGQGENGRWYYYGDYQTTTDEEYSSIESTSVIKKPNEAVLTGSLTTVPKSFRGPENGCQTKEEAQDILKKKLEQENLPHEFDKTVE